MIGDLIVELHELFSKRGIGHAFGGALALNYYAEPRGTNGVDVNVSVPFSDIESLIDELGELGFELDKPLAQAIPAAGVRLHRGLDVVDVFSAFDAFHQRVIDDAQVFPFAWGGGRIDLPFLSANDLIVFKLSFNRLRDWADVDAMLDAGTAIDISYVEASLVALKGPTMYPRVAALRARMATRA
jgi:hypothetical protein